METAISMTARKKINSKWIRDEELLLVDLCLASHGNILGPEDPKNALIPNQMANTVLEECF